MKSQCSMRPLSGRVVIQPDSPMEKIGSILLPQTAQEKPSRGVVVAVSDTPYRFEDGRDARAECAVGQRVLYSRFGGIRYTDPNTRTEYIILHHGEVFMVMPEGAATLFDGRLLSGRMLVAPDEPIQRSAGGIILPDQSKEKPRSGKVVMVSEEPFRYPTGVACEIECAVGDRVLYGRMAGFEYLEDGKEYMILQHNDVFTKL